jgi:hypothetical protein
VILRRLSLLLLLFVLCSGIPSTGSLQSARPEGGPGGIQPTAVKRLLVPTPTSVRPHSISPFSPWRYRLKSVLPETDSRITPESDLGPMPLTEQFYALLVQTPSLGLPQTVIHLRC